VNGLFGMDITITLHGYFNPRSSTFSHKVRWGEAQGMQPMVVRPNAALTLTVFKLNVKSED